jgi:hypothetical protein
VSASNYTLQPSRYVRTGMLLLALMPSLVLAFTPLSVGWLLLLLPALLLYYWQWYLNWSELNQRVMLTLNSDGALHWFGDAPARGQLANGGLVSQFAIKLRWHRQSDRLDCQRWIFADQCSAQQFSALARAINQHNWGANAHTD